MGIVSVLPSLAVFALLSAGANPEGKDVVQTISSIGRVSGGLSLEEHQHHLSQQYREVIHTEIDKVCVDMRSLFDEIVLELLVSPSSSSDDKTFAEYLLLAVADNPRVLRILQAGERSAVAIANEPIVFIKALLKCFTRFRLWELVQILVAREKIQVPKALPKALFKAAVLRPGTGICRDINIVLKAVNEILVLGLNPLEDRQIQQHLNRIIAFAVQLGGTIVADPWLCVGVALVCVDKKVVKSLASNVIEGIMTAAAVVTTKQQHYKA